MLIAEHPLQLKDAVVIQYSISVDLLKKLLEANARVTVFMQHQDTARKIGSEQQVRYIQDGFDYLEMGLPRRMEQYPLKVYDTNLHSNV